MDHVEIGGPPVTPTGLTMGDLIPFESFLEIEIFLPQHQPATEHVLESLNDIPVADRPGRLTGGRRYGTHQNTYCESEIFHEPPAPTIIASAILRRFPGVMQRRREASAGKAGALSQGGCARRCRSRTDRVHR